VAGKKTVVALVLNGTQCFDLMAEIDREHLVVTSLPLVQPLPIHESFEPFLGEPSERTDHDEIVTKQAHCPSSSATPISLRIRSCHSDENKTTTNERSSIQYPTIISLLSFTGDCENLGNGCENFSHDRKIIAGAISTKSPWRSGVFAIWWGVKRREIGF
jgi:hypothetical protein